MKIVVVTYGRETREEIEKDLDRIVSLIDDINDFERLFGKSTLDSIRNKRDVVMLDTSKEKRPYLSRDIRNEKPDLLISYDLAGFELTTLTDGLSYNLIDCRQIHIVSDDKLSNENRLNEVMSINMFFFTKKRGSMAYLKEHYPGIPFIETIEKA